MMAWHVAVFDYHHHVFYFTLPTHSKNGMQVSGVLLGTWTSTGANVVDAVPIAHTHISATTLNVALSLVR